jgi:hypothetical protein
MFDFLSSLSATGAALVIGVAVGAFWLTVRWNDRLQRRRPLNRQAEPCRRCGARN